MINMNFKKALPYSGLCTALILSGCIKTKYISPKDIERLEENTVKISEEKFNELMGKYYGYRSKQMGVDISKYKETGWVTEVVPMGSAVIVYHYFPPDDYVAFANRFEKDIPDEIFEKYYSMRTHELVEYIVNESGVPDYEERYYLPELAFSNFSNDKKVVDMGADGIVDIIIEPCLISYNTMPEFNKGAQPIGWEYEMPAGGYESFLAFLAYTPTFTEYSIMFDDNYRIRMDGKAYSEFTGASNCITPTSEKSLEFIEEVKK